MSFNVFINLRLIVMIGYRMQGLRRNMERAMGYMINLCMNWRGGDVGGFLWYCGSILGWISMGCCLGLLGLLGMLGGGLRRCLWLSEQLQTVLDLYLDIYDLIICIRWMIISLRLFQQRSQNSYIPLHAIYFIPALNQLWVSNITKSSLINLVSSESKNT